MTSIIPVENFKININSQYNNHQQNNSLKQMNKMIKQIKEFCNQIVTNRNNDFIYLETLSKKDPRFIQLLKSNNNITIHDIFYKLNSPLEYHSLNKKYNLVSKKSRILNISSNPEFKNFIQTVRKTYTSYNLEDIPYEITSLSKNKIPYHFIHLDLTSNLSFQEIIQFCLLSLLNLNDNGHFILIVPHLYNKIIQDIIVLVSNLFKDITIQSNIMDFGLVKTIVCQLYSCEPQMKKMLKLLLESIKQKKKFNNLLDYDDVDFKQDLSYLETNSLNNLLEFNNNLHSYYFL